MKQSFCFEWNGKIFGCSFRKANYTNIFMGWVTVYDNRAEYKHPTHWTDWKNIRLTENKSSSINKLKQFCKNLIKGSDQKCNLTTF